MDTLSLEDIQKIVVAVLDEAEKNDDFKSLMLKDAEKAISLIVERDFPFQVKQRYIKSKSQKRNIYNTLR